MQNIAATRHELGDGLHLYSTRLPGALILSPPAFEDLWNKHPAHYHDIVIMGRRTKTPRYQQAYVHTYRYTGSENTALPMLDQLRPHRAWVLEQIDRRLNGLLLNWYDASLGHYIGPHHDTTTDLVKDTPIVTLSFGNERIFRLTREEKRDRNRFVVETRDFVAADGTVFIMPWDTNLRWKHSVPHRSRDRGRRISVTVRAFLDKRDS